MSDPFFFGYGSLVNRCTHGFADARPATVRGWRRAWRHAPIRQVSFLTVVPDPDTVLLGLVARVPGGDWAALDQRERAYRRHRVAAEVLGPPAVTAETAIYAIPEGQHRQPGAENPVLLSYIDTVVQGFLAEFGRSGVTAFFDTTDGWDRAPILDDRAGPRYPRHQSPTPAERRLVDAELDRVAARMTR